MKLGRGCPSRIFRTWKEIIAGVFTMMRDIFCRIGRAVNYPLSVYGVFQVQNTDFAVRKSGFCHFSRARMEEILETSDHPVYDYSRGTSSH
jgi:hypothetical protein